MSKFFLGDDDDRVEPACSPASQQPPLESAVSADLSHSAKGPISDILQFPVELTHAYSYAHMLPNSLAMRLNVLRRSLEILKDRPAFLNLFKNPQPPTENRQHRRNLLELGPNLKPNASLAALAALFLKPGNSDPLYTPPLGPRPSLNNRRVASFVLTPLSSAHPSDQSATKLSTSGQTSTAKRVLLAQESTSHHSLTTPTHTSLHNSPAVTPTSLKTPDASFLSALEKKNFKDIIELLENDPNLLVNNLETAQNLELINQLALEKLLHALAMPFVESTMAPLLLVGDSIPPQLDSPAVTRANSSIRPFQNIALGKHALPQAIFTVEAEMPWPVKAANDLAFLVFGILQATLKNLNLMDLVAPLFRDFVLERMLNNSQSIIFSGEIVAVAPRGADVAWTSVWAKRRGNLVILMFDRIPCDSFDVTLTVRPQDELDTKGKSLEEVDTTQNGIDSVKPNPTIDDQKRVQNDLHSRKSLQDYIDSDTDPDVDSSLDPTPVYPYHDATFKDMSGRFISSRPKPKFPTLLPSIKSILSGNTYEDSAIINKTRYFTICNQNDHYPCAVNSSVLDDDLIKIKVHSLPYIAGMFVISAKQHKILSCNNALAKNLFGRLTEELLEQPIESIIPNFSKILSRGYESKVTKGLVLPEHFFRKFAALLKVEEDITIEETAEELFFTSKGIKGIHRDGNEIWVDLQLRAALTETYALWVTYCRQTREDELSARSSQLSLSEEKKMPNQLNLFEELELDIEETSLSRHGSVRASHTPTPDHIGGTVIKASTSRVGQASQSGQNVQNDENDPTQFDEELLLEEENRTLKEKEAESPNWPTELGKNRRKKKFNEFVVIKNMGEGAYGKVVLAQHKDDAPYRVIVKCIDKEKILVDTWVRDRTLGTIPLEINIMAYLSKHPHPNILRAIDFFEDPQYYYLETSIFGDPPAIDLYDYIEINKTMSEKEYKHIFRQIVLALKHLHEQGIVHRDIKDENVIVDERGVIKIIDFGLAGYIKSGPFDVFVGTIDFALPEVLRGEKYDGRPQDIWALGILLYTLIYKGNPFYNVDGIMEGELSIPYTLSLESELLIRRILVEEVDKRPTIAEIAKDPWLCS